MKTIIFTAILMVGILSNLSADAFGDGGNAFDKNDFKEATKLWGKVCDGGNANGCSNLGFMYENGKGVKQDYFKAVKLYTKACDGGNTSGCTNIGIMYANGQGVKQSNSKAKELFGKACDGGEAEGCKNYAILNE